ncbi:MAG: hypothetical protein AB7E05_04515 [Sphingobium sp.]
MKRSAPRRRLARASFSWRGAVWTLALALCWLGLYDLAHHHALGRWHLVLLIALAVPVAAFMLSAEGQGRDRGRDRPDGPGNRNRGEDHRAG